MTLFKRRPPDDPKKEIVWQALRFVLDPDENRFRKNLLAQLLDEGCNYPVLLAQPLFYRQTTDGLRDKLSPRQQEDLAKIKPEKWSAADHALFYRAVMFLRKKLKKAEEQLAIQVLDSLEAVRRTWLRRPDFFNQSADEFEMELTRATGEMIRANPGGRLAQWPPDLIRRRLNMGLTASLLRYVRSGRDFEKEFGPTDLVFPALERDRELFGRIMSYFRQNIPQFDHIASQIFWRMLSALDAESRSTPIINVF